MTPSLALAAALLLTPASHPEPEPTLRVTIGDLDFARTAIARRLSSQKRGLLTCEGVTTARRSAQKARVAASTRSRKVSM